MFHIGVMNPSREIESYGYRTGEHTLHLGLTISDTAAMPIFFFHEKQNSIIFLHKYRESQMYRKQQYHIDKQNREL